MFSQNAKRVICIVLAVLMALSVGSVVLSVIL